MYFSTAVVATALLAGSALAAPTHDGEDSAHLTSRAANNNIFAPGKSECALLTPFFRLNGNCKKEQNIIVCDPVDESAKDTFSRAADQACKAMTIKDIITTRAENKEVKIIIDKGKTFVGTGEATPYDTTKKPPTILAGKSTKIEFSIKAGEAKVEFTQKQCLAALRRIANGDLTRKISDEQKKTASKGCKSADVFEKKDDATTYEYTQLGSYTYAFGKFKGVVVSAKVLADDEKDGDNKGDNNEGGDNGDEP